MGFVLFVVGIVVFFVGVIVFIIVPDLATSKKGSNKEYIEEQSKINEQTFDRLEKRIDDMFKDGQTLSENDHTKFTEIYTRASNGVSRMIAISADNLMRESASYLKTRSLRKEVEEMHRTLIALETCIKITEREFSRGKK